MITIVANASSLILLTKAEVLEYFLKKAQLVIPRKVYEEAVIKGKEKGTADAYKLEKLIQEGRILLRDVSSKDIQRIESIYNIKAGERDMLALAQFLEISNLLTDDKKAINVCRALDFRFTTALDVLVQLRKEDMIGLEKADDALNKLDEFGWYSRMLIKKAEGDIHAD